MKIAVVGVTGMVGAIMLELLEKRAFPISELIPVASEKNLGKTISFKGKEHKIVTIKDALSRVPKIAFFLPVAMFHFFGHHSLKRLAVL